MGFSRASGYKEIHLYDLEKKSVLNKISVMEPTPIVDMDICHQGLQLVVAREHSVSTYMLGNLTFVASIKLTECEVGSVEFDYSGENLIIATAADEEGQVFKVSRRDLSVKMKFKMGNAYRKTISHNRRMVTLNPTSENTSNIDELEEERDPEQAKEREVAERIKRITVRLCTR